MVPTFGHATSPLEGSCKHISLGPYQRHLIQRGQNEDGEFAFLVVGDDAEAVASWRKLSGQNAEPPFARKPAAVANSAGAREETQTHSARHTQRPAMAAG